MLWRCLCGVLEDIDKLVIIARIVGVSVVGTLAVCDLRDKTCGSAFATTNPCSFCHNKSLPLPLSCSQHPYLSAAHNTVSQNILTSQLVSQNTLTSQLLTTSLPLSCSQHPYLSAAHNTLTSQLVSQDTVSQNTLTTKLVSQNTLTSQLVTTPLPLSW